MPCDFLRKAFLFHESLICDIIIIYTDIVNHEAMDYIKHNAVSALQYAKEQLAF